MENIKFEFLKKISRTGFRNKNLGSLSKLDSVSPPSVFVGSGLKYPNMNVGILSPLEKEENAWIYEDCKFWVKNDFEIGDVVKLREGLLNSKMVKKAKEARNEDRFLSIAKEIALSSSPVDVEIYLRRRVELSKQRDRVLMPSAISAPLKSARISSNTKIDSGVEKIIDDDIGANEGAVALYKKGLDEGKISKILSIGALGLNNNKRLVPTRWSITATDDILSKDILEEVKRFRVVEDYFLHFGEFLGNQYLLLFFPVPFCFELFEIYFPGSAWNVSSEIKASRDFEMYSGRKDYASNCAGGYYATRLAVAEYLKKIRRQAGVIAIRLETPSYWASLGVWVVRESVRIALESSALNFNSKEEFLSSVYQIGKIKYGFESKRFLDKSVILDNLKTQKKIDDFF